MITCSLLKINFLIDLIKDIRVLQRILMGVEQVQKSILFFCRIMLIIGTWC